MLLEREENEAFCLAAGDEEYTIYFTGGGEVILNGRPGEYEVRWMQIRSSHRGEPSIMELPGMLTTPSNDQWAVFLRKL